ncbi:hypothetical protein S40285_00415 [Stachybotrys chlorohalonatus IBT 40285]|uniref:Protein DML1 n=1 Tax=Stachybotrys chlorohalonatus (strain IBT 40285) TaxID=1283841 RepID=A0A084QN43_STAC4|nr:hypothetical protein S40285_00415 [Stachybotrys chlorohalonata IBT 40285]
MREIITLQLGNLSNYVATHFWNAQESYFTYSDKDRTFVDHNIHWRAGLGSDGSETFLPRTVVYDLKGGFGTLRKINALYEDEGKVAADAIWSGPSAIHKHEPLAPSAYQQSLELGSAPAPLTKSTVRYWSDFSRAYLHPKSLVQLYDFELNSTVMPFERFGMGTELFQTLDKEHDIVDRDWRPFVEECDQMQGMQVFTTTDDAWGGFASSYIEALRDEYPKSCLWVWGLQSPLLGAPSDKRQLRLVNTAFGLARIREQASMIVPLSVPEGDMPNGVTLDPSSPWHTSALMATAVESATLPSRLVQGASQQPGSLQEIADNLNSTGNHTLASMSMSVGRSAREKSEDSLDINLSQLGHLRTARKDRNPRVFGHVFAYRGQETADSQETEDPRSRNPRRVIGNTIVQRYTTELQYPLLDSQPPIYADTPDATNLDVWTRLSTDDSMVAQMKALKSQVTWSVGLDEREVLVNDLAEIADAYQDEWSGGSDDDDDDL